MAAGNLDAALNAECRDGIVEHRARPDSNAQDVDAPLDQAADEFRFEVGGVGTTVAPDRKCPCAFFLGEGKNGYCQMFSGSMATILRMLGIPARVAEGFTPGKLDPRSRRFVVTDRDAHAWVEVYFPGAGWVAFDPTGPGRPDQVSPLP